MNNKKNEKNMKEFLEIVVIVALAAAFLVLLTKKWGIAEWMQVHGDRYVSQLFSCDFCMSFWSAVFVTAIVICFRNDAAMLLVPVLSTPITRMLV